MLKDKRVVVLGGTHGIGFAVAVGAARQGASVVIASSKQASVDAALERLPKGSAGHAVDLRSAEAMRELFDRLGAIDHLAYTAGESLLLAPFAELDLVAARQFFELRYWGALAAVKAAQPHLRKGGSIVLTSGTAGTRPYAGFAIGGSICAAVEAAARALAVELAPIRVNVVVPGFVDTGLWQNLGDEARAQLYKDVAGKLPTGRIGTPEDIAEHYLSFMRGGYTTGQKLVVDGGGVLV